MKILWGIASYIALSATIFPAVLVFSGTIDLEMHKRIMAIGMILWFIAAPLCMKKRSS
jgi:high-affinity Fe2+/Pb2+ permease